VHRRQFGSGHPAIYFSTPMIDRMQAWTISEFHGIVLRSHHRFTSDKEIQMSEKTSIGEQAVELTGVVELGNASKETRGSAVFLGLLDGGLSWPFLFYLGH
jgi:hypothetical protein